jgi:IS30 family transposase
MSYCHLSSEERYVISYLVLSDLSLREIGCRIGRHHSTISREIKRNRPTYADDAFTGMMQLNSMPISEKPKLITGANNLTAN